MPGIVLKEEGGTVEGTVDTKESTVIQKDLKRVPSAIRLTFKSPFLVSLPGLSLILKGLPQVLYLPSRMGRKHLTSITPYYVCHIPNPLHLCPRWYPPRLNSCIWRICSSLLKPTISVAKTIIYLQCDHTWGMEHCQKIPLHRRESYNLISDLKFLRILHSSK